MLRSISLLFLAATLPVAMLIANTDAARADIAGPPGSGPMGWIAFFCVGLILGVGIVWWMKRSRK